MPAFGPASPPDSRRRIAGWKLRHVDFVEFQKEDDSVSYDLVRKAGAGNTPPELVQCRADNSIDHMIGLVCCERHQRLVGSRIVVKINFQ